MRSAALISGEDLIENHQITGKLKGTEYKQIAFTSAIAVIRTAVVDLGSHSEEHIQWTVKGMDHPPKKKSVILHQCDFPP